MADVFSKEKRSWIMGRVRGRDTGPEMTVRRMIHAMGFRFRLHRKDLPGRPDIVLPGRRKIVFVHGCFWHGHAGCPRSRRPETNKEFWDRKIDGNIKRDKKIKAELKRLGWKALVVWECRTRTPDDLMKILERFLYDGGKRA